MSTSMIPGGSGGLGINDLYPVNTITESEINPTPSTYHLVDATIGEVNIELPMVTAGDTGWYSFTLSENSSHCNISVTGGTQTIQGDTILSISTEKTQVVLKANGVDGYESVGDGREYYRVNVVTEDTNLSGGLESGGLYVCEPADGENIVITIANWEAPHIGDYSIFTKSSGENSSVIIKSVDNSFNETIIDNGKGFQLSAGATEHVIVQDSRPSPSNVTINFFPSTNTSVFEVGYAGVLETTSEPEEIFTTAPITVTDELNPQSLGFFINDNKALIGTLSARPITAVARVKKTSNFTREAKVKFKYYEYDFGTNILNPVELSETAFSSEITSNVSFSQVFVSGTLPENTWATDNASSEKLLVIELLAVKTGSGGADSDPTIDFRFGGTDPSRTSLDVPVASINHNTLGGVVPAAANVPDGHISSAMPIAFPSLTTAERNAITPVNGMMFYNETTAQFEKYQAGAWIATTLILRP